MAGVSITRQAVEAMAERAYQTGTPVAELFATAYHVSFTTRGHTENESIEREVNVTPELIARAQRLLDERR